MVPEAFGAVSVRVVPVAIPLASKASSLVESPLSEMVKLLSWTWTAFDLSASVEGSESVGLPETPSPLATETSLVVPAIVR